MDGSGARLASRRRWWWILVAFILFAGGWGFTGGIENDANEHWTRVERQDLVIGVEVDGELKAIDSANLGPPQVRSIWEFKISYMAPEGSEVLEGQPVLGFDTTQLQQTLLTQIAERDSAAKNLEKQTTDIEIERRDLNLQLAEGRAALRRAKLKLGVAENLTARRELEQADIDRRLATMQIEHLEANREHLEARSNADLSALREQHQRAATRVEEIEAHVSAMTVKAPRAGTVIYKTQRREKKKVGDPVWRADTVIEIPDLTRMRGEAQVAEADAGRVEEGQRVTLYLDAYPDLEYEAKVVKIHRTVQQKSWRNPQKIVRLDIELASTDVERMRPGMRFRGKIETERISDTLVVPRDSVFSRDVGSVVVVRSLFGRREVAPIFGERNADLFAVVSGLKQGDRVLRRGGGTKP